MDPLIAFYLGAVLGVCVGFIFAGSLSSNCDCNPRKTTQDL